MADDESLPPRSSSPRLASARSRAHVVFCKGERRQAERASLRLFRRTLAPWKLAGLAGAPHDAEVEVGILQGDLYLELHKPGPEGYLGVQVVRRVRSRVVLLDEALHIHRRGMRRKGLGLRIFYRQLVHAHALGVIRIETDAGRADHENGYYTWPRFGFDGPLPPKIRPMLPPGLASARSMLDLMNCERGRQWWQKNGTPVRLAFEVAAHSRSWRVFEQYLLKRRPQASPTWPKRTD